MTTETQMWLSEAEVRLVIAERKKIAEYREREAKKKICEHELVYWGHGHNDDWYECHKCGYGEWR